MSPQILKAHEEFRGGALSREEFLRRLTALAGGATATAALLPLLEASSADADTPKEAPTVHTEDVEYPGATGAVRAHLARPQGDAKFPGVIVIHENRGLTPHIRDVANRLADEGFLALAPDALSPFGGTPQDADQARDLIGKLDSDATLRNFLAAIAYLKAHPSLGGKVGCVGFCWGGRMANLMAVNSPELAAAVPYYGSQPAAEDVPKIKASLLLHYAGLDDRINAGIEAFETALKAAHVDYRLHIYPGAQHAFNNDSNPERYNPEAAQRAWKRTIAFFKEKLRT
jgi:carboxymethylenebutenolidase